MKKVLSALLSLAIALSLSATAFAENNVVADADFYFDTYANDFEEYTLQKMQARSAVTPEEIITSFISENGSDYDLTLLQESSKEETINLDDENSITLDGIMIYANGANDVAVTPERAAKGAIDLNSSSRSTRSITPVKSYYHAVYALLLGQEIYRITQEAQFTYTGSSVSVNYSDGYYERGFLSIWQVSDFEDSKESTINGSAVVKSSANFHYGLEINGVGLVIQDNNCWVDVRCTKNGSVSGYCDGGHNDPIFDIL